MGSSVLPFTAGGRLRRRRGLVSSGRCPRTRRFTANLRIFAAALRGGGEARTKRVSVAARLLEADPGFRVGPFSERYAFRDRDRRAALAAHLRAAGLPD